MIDGSLRPGKTVPAVITSTMKHFAADYDHYITGKAGRLGCRRQPSEEVGQIMISITINGKKIKAEEGKTILEVAQAEASTFPPSAPMTRSNRRETAGSAAWRLPRETAPPLKPPATTWPRTG